MRNLRIGDVCFIQDANQTRGHFRRCRVVNVFPDKDGVVRNVEVVASSQIDGSSSYHPQQLSKLKRHASNLILIAPVDEGTNGSGDNGSMAGNNVELNCTDTNTLICYRNLEELAPCEGDLLVAAVPSHDGLDSVPEGAYQVPAGKQASIRGGVRKDLSYAFWKLADVGVEN